MRMNSFGIAAFLLVSACSANNTATQSNELGEFAQKLNSYDDVMTESRPELRFSDGTTARNCQEYLVLRNETEVSEEVSNRAHLVDYRVCDTLAALKDAIAVGDTYSPGVPEGEVLKERLDLRSFRSSLGPVSSRYHTFSDMPDDLPVRVEGKAVILESEDWYLRLEVVAKADVDSDGHEDWLVWLTDEARNGNYRGYETLLIHNVTSGGLLEAKTIGR